ncbi:MAG TPA: pyruvate kinase [Candidatus Faecivicinus avistercoris]|nr:pyruvate kinase [Candidatus Faecivicinus avistercoris]
MRKTKIICTIGPASEDEEILTKMCLAGMNVARVNFSHGTHEEHHRKIETIKRVREKLGLPIAIMLDTKGPEYRIRTFKDGKIMLKEGEPFTLTVDDVEGDETRVSVNYAGLVNDLKPGDRVLLNNGLLSLVVDGIEGHDIHCTVTDGGELSNRKSMSFPNKVLNQVYLSEQDKQDMLFGIEHDVDYIACSFVSVRQDLIDVHNFLNANGGGHISLIAKIENQSGIDNIEDICEECEGIMIGRGDMGVEIPYEELPAIQKKLITKCRMIGKRVITATEMLESMIYNPRPTRAEISDVANAVYDGTSAIMLSGETAAGKHPVEAVAVMAKIALATEENINYRKRFRSTEFQTHSTVDAISHATCGMAIDIGAKAIVVCSLSGMTARMISRFRSPVDILGITTSEHTWRKLALSWGVVPTMSVEYKSTDVLFYVATQLAREKLGLKSGDKIVITGGVPSGQSGNTNLIKVEVI